MKNLLFFTLIIFVSCNNLSEIEQHENPVQSVPQPDKPNITLYPKLNVGRHFETVEEVINFVAYNITYKKEPIGHDHWQSPWETWELKTGDCEDFCILAMYLLKIELNIDSELLIIKTFNDNHAIITIGSYYYDIINNLKYIPLFPIGNKYSIVLVKFSFKEVFNDILFF